MNKIDTVKGIGPKTSNLLIKSGIETISDLLSYYPYRFEIFARSNIKDLNDEDRIVIDGIVENNSQKLLKVSLFNILPPRTINPFVE